MENKYKMTLEDNIFWAKRNIIDTIYKSAKLEGINVTFPQTEAIYNGGVVSNVSVLDIEKVLGLKHAWEFIIETIDLPVNYAYLCKVHELCAVDVPLNLRGKIRNVPVNISGTNWQPQYPIESQIKEELEEVLKILNPTERAIKVMLWGMRRQMFLDGNKRTSMLLANKILISNGCGILAVRESDLEEFGSLLINYYETGLDDKITKFIYENVISGFNSADAVQ